jgi:DNA polymerase-3 subunit delta'
MAEVIAPLPVFRTLIGQEKAKDLLRRAGGYGRLSHAYLFRGPAGVGKKRAVLAFAAAINCLHPVEGDACGACASCLKFASGNHPDFSSILPDGAAIKINQVRALKKALGFPPLEARFRVVLLADVHTMRREAANSLLKTLEEPPADTMLILTGDEASTILPTIVSRCQVIPFFALPYEEVAAALQEEGVPPAEAATLAAVTEGSLGRARLLAAKDLLTFRREIVETLLPLAPDAPEAVTAVFTLAERAAALKENLPELLALLRIWLRDLVLLASGMPSSLAASRDLADLLAAAAGRWQPEHLFVRLHQLEQANRYLRRNCNRAAVCEVLFFSLL